MGIREVFSISNASKINYEYKHTTYKVGSKYPKNHELPGPHIIYYSANAVNLSRKKNLRPSFMLKEYAGFTNIPQLKFYIATFFYNRMQ